MSQLSKYIITQKKNKKNKIGLKKVIDLDKVKLYLHLGIKSTVYGCKVKKKMKLKKT